MAQLELLNAQAPAPGPKRVKADDAYKTIREVAQELGVPQHVLRFWESHFPQVRPPRMRGARRYYRPQDVETLKRIKGLLYSQGYTIKGAKKLIGGKATAAAKAIPKPPAPKKNHALTALAKELKALQEILEKAV